MRREKVADGVSNRPPREKRRRIQLHSRTNVYIKSTTTSCRLQPPKHLLVSTIGTVFFVQGKHEYSGRRRRSATALGRTPDLNKLRMRREPNKLDFSGASSDCSSFKFASISQQSHFRYSGRAVELYFGGPYFQARVEEAFQRTRKPTLMLDIFRRRGKLLIPYRARRNKCV